MNLTPDLLRSFKEKGYVLIKGFLSPEEITAVNEHLHQLIKEKVPAMPPEHAFYEDKNDPGTLKQLQVLFKYDPFFAEMMFDSKFERLAAFLLEDIVFGKNMQYFNKPPRIGAPTPAHQDGYYFMLDPNEAVTMWLGLERVDEQNGCVRYVEGSHKKGMRTHDKTAVLGFSQGIQDFGTPDDNANEVFFATQAGDLLVHHSLTIHRADGNNSADRTRRALGFIYYAAGAKEDAQRKQSYQQKLAEEIREKADQKLR